jgi:hypothetical protein
MFFSIIFKLHHKIQSNVNNDSTRKNYSRHFSLVPELKLPAAIQYDATIIATFFSKRMVTPTVLD